MEGSSISDPITRSGSNYSAPRDSNRVPVTFGVSTADGITPVPIEVNPANGQLQTSSSGGGGGTQYQELATTSPATGTLALGRYQTSFPTLTNGQMNEPMLDVSSRLLVTDTTINTTLGTTNSSLSTIATNTGAGATSANQTNASQKTQVVDGSGNVIGSTSNALNINISSGNITGYATSANQTNGTQQTKITNGTNLADVTANDSGYNGVSVNSATKTMTFTTSATGAQQLLANTDCRGYGWITVVLTSVGGGLAWNGQFSPNSGGTYISTATWKDQTSATATPTLLPTTVNRFYSGPVVSDFFQLNISTMTSGTTSGYVVLSTFPTPFTSIDVAQAGTWNMGLSASASGAYSFSHIAAGQATTTVKSGAGTLHAIIFNGAATATNVTTIYDNTTNSGTVIGIPAATAVTTPESVIYDLAFATGLTINTATANGSDMTVVYK